MRQALRLRPLLLLLAGLLLAFGATSLPGPAAAAGPADLCRPDPDCRRDCARGARRAFGACLEAGHPPRECRQRVRDLRRACKVAECGPVLDCRDRCVAQGVRLLGRCLATGGALEACRADSEKATRACVERRCEGCFCPQIYAPVCGVDDMTYGNACEASCAGVEVAHEGACEPVCKPITCDLFCEFGHRAGPDGCPTCACNPPPGCRSDADCPDEEQCREICPLRPCLEGDPFCGACVGVCLPAADG